MHDHSTLRLGTCQLVKSTPWSQTLDQELAHHLDILFVCVATCVARAPASSDLLLMTPVELFS